ncbi:hypothetical protein CEP52_017733, partial [Fusarium oligoseptatum]
SKFSFFDENAPGQILSRFTNDINKTDAQLNEGLIRIVMAVVMALAPIVVIVTARNLEIDNSLRNAASAKGKSSWAATNDLDHLPPFEHEATFRVSWDKPTPVILTSDSRRTTTTLPDIFGTESSHIPVLLLAWAYILSARWAELIPSSHLSQHPSQPTHQLNGNGLMTSPRNRNPITVHVGEVDEDAARWWNMLLSGEGCWEATMRNSRGNILYSPWSTKLVSEQPFLISAKIKAIGSASSHSSLATSNTAHRYLSEYCHFHSINDQKQAALAAALLIPVAKFDYRPIELAMLNFPYIFFEPDVTSNICGMWLPGSFALLNSVQDPHILLKTLMERDPGLGGLWVGAFITGAYSQCLQDGRAAWWKIDLNAAAWTET